MKPTPSPPIDPRDSPPLPGSALVVERWNAWVRVRFPDSGETAWVNLDEVGFQTVPGSGSRDED